MTRDPVPTIDAIFEEPKDIAPALDHTFGPKLTCSKCDRTWSDQQLEPTECGGRPEWLRWDE